MNKRLVNKILERGKSPELLDNYMSRHTFWNGETWDCQRHPFDFVDDEGYCEGCIAKYLRTFIRLDGEDLESKNLADE